MRTTFRIISIPMGWIGVTWRRWSNAAFTANGTTLRASCYIRIYIFPIVMMMTCCYFGITWRNLNHCRDIIIFFIRDGYWQSHVLSGKKVAGGVSILGFNQQAATNCSIRIIVTLLCMHISAAPSDHRFLPYPCHIIADCWFLSCRY